MLQCSLGTLFHKRIATGWLRSDQKWSGLFYINEKGTIMAVYKEDKQYRIREKLDEIREKAEEILSATFMFIMDHPREAAAIASVAVFGARKIDKYIDIHRETKLRNSMIYDRSLGMYWETKRPLTTNQRLVIETRHKGGEPYGKILSDMRLLKR